MNSEHPNIKIDVEPRPDGVVLAHVSGEVDALTEPVLRDCVDQQLRSSRHFVLDLDAVRFLSASGLAALLDIKRRASRGGLRWSLVAAGHAVRRPLQATGLDQQLPVYPTVGKALAAVSPVVPWTVAG
ncbi:anti-anti-sigma factor [Herbihabitans rhizosphaerae]|uniref:Anti-sigma factor antagonist n=1 Tax=Herbihabitans rhizosphaerae TaxID=1872711 RepID=A0A4Q7KFS3_9PSEU|nr:STAS domain-containing protein [Herbihabitans rhizosphaerae]RZS32820.1 anti-anti-sigma factor [Herbihabitans rhizosphaerae]